MLSCPGSIRTRTALSSCSGALMLRRKAVPLIGYVLGLVFCFLFFVFFKGRIYLFIYLFIYGCVGSSFLREGFL